MTTRNVSCIVVHAGRIREQGQQEAAQGRRVLDEQGLHQNLMDSFVPRWLVVLHNPNVEERGDLGNLFNSRTGPAPASLAAGRSGQTGPVAGRPFSFACK